MLVENTYRFNLSEYLSAILIYCYRHDIVHAITTSDVLAVACPCSYFSLAEFQHDAYCWQALVCRFSFPTENEMKGWDVTVLPLNTDHYTSDSSSCSLAESYKGIFPKHVNIFLWRPVNCPRKFWGLILCSSVSSQNFLQPTISLF